MSKSHEKIHILTGLCFLCITSLIAFGAEPPVQMATLRWNGDGEFMSWRWEKLGEAFEDGAARFAADSRIVSPKWAELDVLGAEEVDDGADGWEGVALGRRETDIECGFELIPHPICKAKESHDRTRRRGDMDRPEGTLLATKRRRNVNRL